MAKHEMDLGGFGNDAGRADQLLIKPNGEYEWGELKGTWHPANKADLHKIAKGATGVVLEKFIFVHDPISISSKLLPAISGKVRINAAYFHASVRDPQYSRGR